MVATERGEMATFSKHDWTQSNSQINMEYGLRHLYYHCSGTKPKKWTYIFKNLFVSGKSLESEIEVDEFATVWRGMVFKICNILGLVPAEYYVLAILKVWSWLVKHWWRYRVLNSTDIAETQRWEKQL